MRRTMTTAFAATLILWIGSASAQDGDLAGVTMRVLDDVSEIRAVILDLDSSRGEDDGGAARDGNEASSAERKAAEVVTEDRFAESRAELHDPDDDERSEGKLEDNDVEQPAPTP